MHAGGGVQAGGGPAGNVEDLRPFRTKRELVTAMYKGQVANRDSLRESQETGRVIRAYLRADAIRLGMDLDPHM